MCNLWKLNDMAVLVSRGCVSCSAHSQMSYCLWSLYVIPTQVKDYYDIIKNPMDFGEVWKRLGVSVENCSQSQYTEISDVLKDVKLVFENCERYNEVRVIKRHSLLLYHARPCDFPLTVYVMSALEA